MNGPVGRAGWIAAGLLGVALALMGLSFVPWGLEATAGVDPTPDIIAKPASTAEPTKTPAEVGRTLFTIKGCATCHQHDGLQVERLTSGGEVVPVGRAMTGMDGAPNLTNYDPDPTFIRTWLKDPRAIRPNTRMPNLGLKEHEIEALLAFLEE